MAPLELEKEVADLTKREILHFLRERKLELIVRSREQPNYHYLSEEDFSQTDIEPRDYEVDQAVTRENFISFIITSFSFSRGSQFDQWLFMEWVKAKTDFDYSRTLDCFLKKGGWHRLSKAEQEKYARAFARVTKSARHKVSNHHLFVFDREIRNLRTLFKEMSQSAREENGITYARGDKVDVTIPYPLSNLKNMSYADLSRR